MASTAESSAPAPAPKEKDVTKELAIQARNYYNRTQVPDGVSDGKLYYSPARISGVKEALEKLNKLATESEDIKILDRHGGEMISIDEAIVSIKANLKLSEEIHLEKGYKVPEASEGAEAEESVESDAEKVEKRKDEFVQQAKEKFAKFVKLMNKLEKLPEFTEAEELKERAKKAIDTFVEKLNAISSGGSAEDLGSPVTEMQAIEQEAKKLNIDLEKGQVVSWTNEKGEKLAGFVTGLAKKGKGIMIRIGDKDHIVNRQDVKIESGSSAEIKTEVVKATSFESLKTLLPDYLTVGSKIYDKKELQDMVDLIVKSNPAIESPLVHALPKEGGFRNKVIELLQPHLLEVKRNNYADKYAKVSKKFGGVVGWIRRATNSGAYLKDMEGLQESKDTYMEARAETVAAKMEKWTSEQMALSDAKAEAFQKEKGWGSKVYDLYRNNKYIRKFNKGRLYVGLGLMGASLVAGAPVLATAGAFGGAYFAASRAFGFVGGSMGSYELMNWADKRKGTKIPLSPEIKSKLKEYKKQIKGVLANKEAAIQEQMDEYVRKNGLSRSEKSEDPGYLALANQLKERKRLIQQKTVELQAEQAIELPDDQLEKVLIYYQTVVVRNGIKISEDPKYQMLLKEKARRMKGVIDGLKAQDVSSEKAKIGAEDRERLERAVEARAEHLRELAIHRTDDYIRNVILTFVRQQELNKVKGTAAQRKKSPEYKRAQACQNVLDKRYKNLPPDIQVVLDQLSAKGTKNPAEYYQQIYTTESVKKIMKVRKHGFEEDINLFSINLEAWEMNDDFKSHLNEVLSNNELIKKQAQEDVLNDMETFVTAVAEKEKRVEAKVNALEEILAKKLNAIDERAESEALQKQWSNETRRTVRKVIAVEIGALFASGVVQRKLMGMAFGSGEAAAGEVSDTRASGGGEVVEPTPTVAEGTPGPERELVAGVDYPGEAVLPEDDAGVTGAEVETAAVKAAEVETAVVEEHPVPAVEAVLDATYPEQTFEFGDGDSVSRIMDIETMDHGQEMFPSQWEEALESAGGNETVAKESFNEFIHDWKMGQLKGLGYDWVKFDGQYHYGYPFTPHAGAELSFVQDPEAMGGWKIEMADHHLTEHDQLRFRDLPAEAWQNGSVKTVLGETIEAPKDLEVAAVEKSVELPVAEASEPVSEAPIEEPIADPDLEPEEVLAEESIVEPEEVPAEELATETEQAPAEPRMDTSNPGEVYMESDSRGLNRAELVDNNILRDDWVDHARGAGNNPALAQQAIESRASRVFNLQQAMERAAASGDAEAVAKLGRNIDLIVNQTENKYGPVFESGVGEVPEVEVNAGEAGAELEQSVVDEPAETGEPAGFEGTPTERAAEFTKLHRSDYPGVGEMQNEGIIRKGYLADLEGLDEDGEVKQNQVANHARRIVRLEDALADAKEAGDNEAAKILEEKIDNNYKRIPVKYREAFVHYNNEPVVEAPEPAVGDTELVGTPYDRANEYINDAIPPTNETIANGDGAVLRDDWIQEAVKVAKDQGITDVKLAEKFVSDTYRQATDIYEMQGALHAAEAAGDTSAVEEIKGRLASNLSAMNNQLRDAIYTVKY